MLGTGNLLLDRQSGSESALGTEIPVTLKSCGMPDTNTGTQMNQDTARGDGAWVWRVVRIPMEFEDCRIQLNFFVRWSGSLCWGTVLDAALSIFWAGSSTKPSVCLLVKWLLGVNIVSAYTIPE